MVEYEFSAWYFLFFTIFYKNTTNTTASQETKTVDMSLLVPELSMALASKLNVPASVFTIAKAEKYRSVVGLRSHCNVQNSGQQCLESQSFI